MWLTLVTLAPVALVLWLIAFDQYGLALTRRNVAATLGGALVLGPLAIAVLGFFGWLVAVALVVCLATAAVVMRLPREPLAR